MNRTAPQMPNLTPAARNIAPNNLPAANEKRHAFADRLEKLEQRNYSKKSAKDETASAPLNKPLMPPPAEKNTSDLSENPKPADPQKNILPGDRGRKPSVPLDEKTNATLQSAEQVAAPFFRASQIQIQNVAAPNDVPPAHLERMASAIQELHAKDARAEFQINLPLGPTHVETAVLGRDAQGRIIIQLQTASILPPQVVAQMSNALMHRLRQKDIKVSDVKFTSDKVRGKTSK